MIDNKKCEHFKDVVMGVINSLAETNENVVMLDADLASCLGSNSFKKLYPNRFFNCGIAEANMVGVAAGLSSMGLMPFAHSFGCFASRRVYDQLFLSVGYAKQCVHMIASDPGITAQYNGGTHMPFEDIALIRQIPNFILIEPSDSKSCRDLLMQIAEQNNPSYTRVPRKGIVHRYNDDVKIELGKGLELTSGEDVAIIATGAHLVSEAQKAVEELSAQGINATLIDLHTIKPLDEELILKVAKRCGKMLVCENGRYAGGTGELIAGFLAKNNPIKMDFINVGDKFGEVGNLKYLASAFNFTAEEIVKKASALIK